MSQIKSIRHSRKLSMIPRFIGCNLLVNEPKTPAIHVNKQTNDLGLELTSYLHKPVDYSPLHENSVLSLSSKVKGDMAAEVQSNTHSVIEIGTAFDRIVPEQPVTFLVRQAFAFFYKICVSPSMVTFDAKSGVYRRKGGTKFNKVRSNFFKTW